MKKRFLLIALLATFSLAMKEPDPKVFSTPTLVWCGLDFSQVKCIGPAGFSEPDEIKNRYFDAWNNLVLAESDKYNVQEFYMKGKQENDLSVVTERNEIPEVEGLVINDDYALEEGKVEQMISEYDLEDHDEGLGLVYIVEALNKNEKKAAIYVVFFDIASKDILWQQKYNESAGGFGFRNYWAGAIHKTMEASEKDYKKALKKMSKG
ncbi:hypothetical protein [Catalinimonas niigatensis]|uniref:hypothetical protein n=1 Tax=Catalinimonas niigatensis TaxID=1397264 RepID=UPI002665B990|nr:hypothetical protein [Catalinimonas niigatensis]WPP48779.1 hypothetical protein PZB72_19110 [Catalinimonas niigatensis]